MAYETLDHLEGLGWCSVYCICSSLKWR